MTDIELMTVARAILRIRAHYDEMPGLSLTAAQAARLAGLERPLAATAMRALESEGYLVRNWNGRLLRRDHTLLQRDGWSRPRAGDRRGAADSTGLAVH